MSYDFTPKNKNAGDFQLGAFSWPWMLDAGVGLPLCNGRGYKPGQFVEKVRPDGLSIRYNDGATVTASEAKQMAQIAIWVADYQDTLRECFDKEPQEKKQEMEKHDVGRHLYNFPVREDFVTKLREFAEFAVKSGGFKIT